MSILCCTQFSKFTVCDYYNLNRNINQLCRILSISKTIGTEEHISGLVLGKRVRSHYIL